MQRTLTMKNFIGAYPAGTHPVGTHSARTHPVRRIRRERIRRSGSNFHSARLNRNTYIELIGIARPPAPGQSSPFCDTGQSSPFSNTGQSGRFRNTG